MAPPPAASNFNNNNNTRHCSQIYHAWIERPLAHLLASCIALTAATCLIVGSFVLRCTMMILSRLGGLVSSSEPPGRHLSTLLTIMALLSSTRSTQAYKTRPLLYVRTVEEISASRRHHKSKHDPDQGNGNLEPKWTEFILHYLVMTGLMAVTSIIVIYMVQTTVPMDPTKSALSSSSSSSKDEPWKESLLLEPYSCVPRPIDSQNQSRLLFQTATRLVVDSSTPQSWNQRMNQQAPKGNHGHDSNSNNNNNFLINSSPVSCLKFKTVVDEEHDMGAPWM